MKRFVCMFDVLAGATVVAAVIMGLCADSYAGTDLQGKDLQGKDLQGKDLQGKDLQGAWLQGKRFEGVLMDADRSEAIIVEVLGFRGDAIDARLWRPESDELVTTVLRPRDLVGLQWLERRCNERRQCARIRYRIVDAEQDTSRNTMPGHGDNGDLWLYRVEHITLGSPGPRDWRNVCRADRHGLARGLFVDGRWARDGSRQRPGYTFACTSGVIAKCVRSWGYKPWKQLLAVNGTPAQTPVDLAPLHQACTRAARADYCGNGTAHTRDGTLIDLFDSHDFNVPEADPTLRQEAGFTRHGAAWVARTRWPMGAEARGPWLDLGPCRRPRRPLPKAQEQALVQVRSQPRHAR